MRTSAPSSSPTQYLSGQGLPHTQRAYRVDVIRVRQNLRASSGRTPASAHTPRRAGLSHRVGALATVVPLGTILIGKLIVVVLRQHQKGENDRELCGILLFWRFTGTGANGVL
jgi:hypothetical protein